VKVVRPECAFVGFLTFAEPSLTNWDASRRRQGPHSCPIVTKKKIRDEDMSTRGAGCECVSMRGKPWWEVTGHE